MKFLSSQSEQSTFPLVAVRDGIVFPSTENVLLFGRKKSLLAVSASLKKGYRLILVMQKDPSLNEPKKNDLYRVGVIAKIEKVSKGEKGEVSALLKGEGRVKIIQFVKEEPFFEVKAEALKEKTVDSEKVQALIKHITNSLKKAVSLGKGIDFTFLMHVMSGVTSLEFSNQIAMILDIKTEDRQELLEELDLLERLRKEAEFINHEVKILELERSISVKTQKKFEKGMKDAVLREKMKTIEQELGEGEKEGKEIKGLRDKIKKAKMPKEAEKKALQELKRLSQMSQFNPEASYIRTYLDWLVEIPWSEESPSDVDIKKAEKILDEDHYGLKKVKERILEYLAVMKLKQSKKEKGRKQTKTAVEKRQEKQPTILCFVGPPGVGKTSIGQSIARALGRAFVKISLGGIRDEAEIRGHRRTYVGALPGRIIQGIREAGTKNPIFMLDEIDKVGRDFRGDPSAALLEALDPEQNHSFSDHYLEVDFDLSDVMFITTGNILDTIPDALRDRLEIIHFPGYTEDEKFNIGKNFLVKKQLGAHGLTTDEVELTDNVLKLIIRRYTREAGVRELERQIAALFRKVARQFVEDGKKVKKVQKKDVHQYLGPYKYSSQMIEQKDSVGIATGLAWTRAGGDILFIEVAIMPGKGRLTLTGHLGDVMKESCRAALSYVRSRWDLFGLKEDFYNQLDIHVHVPEGAVPKDGPSAGIAIATSMVSALTKIPVKKDVGMTGEITLRGRVMEVGGVKEKIIAAHRAGIKKVILAKDNKKDLEDIPKKVLSDLSLSYVDHMDKVIKGALSFPSKKFQFVTLQKPKLN